MGMFATLKGEQYIKCPKCGKRAEWQSKGLWLTYKGRKFWIGDHSNIELDENMDGHIVAWCWGKDMGWEGCGRHTYFKIVKGKLIESSEEGYQN